jgi:hypothetical protein
MTKEQVIELAKQAGFNASVGKTDKEGNYHPYVNAIGRDVPFEWVERFYALVRNAALEDAKQLFSQPHQEYFGRDAQDAIESLKEPTP